MGVTASSIVASAVEVVLIDTIHYMKEMCEEKSMMIKSKIFRLDQLNNLCE